MPRSERFIRVSKAPGSAARLAELFLERAHHRGDERGAHTMAHHVADEDADGGIRDGNDVVIIAAHRTGRVEDAAEFHRARRLVCTAWERGETVGKESHLEFAGHFQILLHEGVFRGEFAGALGDALFELGVERAQRRLRLAAGIPLGDFPHRPVDRGDEPAAEPVLQHEVRRAILEKFHRGFLSHGT